MAAKFTIDKGGSTASKLTPRYVPSYANPEGKSFQQASRTNALAQRAGMLGSNAPRTTTTTGGGGRTTTPASVIPDAQFTAGPVSVTPTDPFDLPGSAPIEPEPQYSVYDDPFYQQALQGAQSRFNLDRASALAGNQYEERGINRQLEDRKGTAEDSRRRLAGNYASRGMGGGRAGALTRAEADMNARELTARTGLREQIAELGRQFTSQYGAEGSDWLGTRYGMEAQQSAIQQALQNRLAGLTTVG
jgi:hypothetical protein